MAHQLEKCFSHKRGDLLGRGLHRCGGLLLLCLEESGGDVLELTGDAERSVLPIKRVPLPDFVHGWVLGRVIQAAELLGGFCAETRVSRDELLDQRSTPYLVGFHLGFCGLNQTDRQEHDAHIER